MTSGVKSTVNINNKEIFNGSGMQNPVGGATQN